MTKQEQLRNQIDLENQARTKAIRLRKESGMQSAVEGLKREVEALRSTLDDIAQRVRIIETTANSTKKGRQNG